MTFYIACLYIAFGFVLTSTAEPAWQFGNGKIVGGSPINITEAPYQVVVQLGGALVCGGSIIAPTFILTAGHCIVRTTIYFSVRAGTSDHLIGGSIHNATNISVHPLYDDVLYDYDVAIIEIDPPIVYDDVRQPIKIVESAPEGGNVTISGWGTESVDGSTSRMLQSVTIPVVRHKLCNELYAEYGGITSRMMCSGSPGHDSCLGDSGSPVTIDGKIAGTVSWANGCALENYPGVNANLADLEIRNFIRQVTNV